MFNLFDWLRKRALKLPAKTDAAIDKALHAPAGTAEALNEKAEQVVEDQAIQALDKAIGGK